MVLTPGLSRPDRGHDSDDPAHDGPERRQGPTIDGLGFVWFGLGAMWPRDLIWGQRLRLAYRLYPLLEADQVQALLIPHGLAERVAAGDRLDDGHTRQVAPCLPGAGVIPLDNGVAGDGLDLILEG